MTTMAKASAKKTSTVKKAATPRKLKAASVSIEQVSAQALQKLQALNAEPQLQADIAWCLGSYRYDKNPIGLIQKGSEALAVFKAIKEKSAKAVPAKLIKDLEKALNQA
jgi:PIN domain nuclease of toxin-antitoxin system